MWSSSATTPKGDDYSYDKDDDSDDNALLIMINGQMGYYDL